MRQLRTFLISMTSFIGIAAVFVLLTVLTGHLMGIITPQLIVATIATLAVRIAATKLLWWAGAMVGWYVAGWTAWRLIRIIREEPIPIREDEMGAIEVTPDAVRGLANAVAKAKGMPSLQRTEFFRESGKPTLRVWTDLVSGTDGDGPIRMGEELRVGIEERLREDFSIEGMRINVIHRPVKGSKTSAPPPPSAQA